MSVTMRTIVEFRCERFGCTNTFTAEAPTISHAYQAAQDLGWGATVHCPEHANPAARAKREARRMR